MKSPLRPLANGLLIPRLKWLGLGAVWALSGCLIPQDESYLSELPVPGNHPPRIVENQVQPSDRIIRGYGLEKFCQLEFSIPVEDPDVGDTLSVHWFVDYDPSQPRGADSVVRIEPNGEVLRGQFAYFRPPVFGSADISRLNVPGDHVVEVVVTDTGLVGRDPLPRTVSLPDGTTREDAGYTATYAWFVHTETGTGGSCQ